MVGIDRSICVCVLIVIELFTRTRVARLMELNCFNKINYKDCLYISVCSCKKWLEWRPRTGTRNVSRSPTTRTDDIVTVAGNGWTQSVLLLIVVF